jgi:hypothetical protein
MTFIYTVATDCQLIDWHKVNFNLPGDGIDSECAFITLLVDASGELFGDLMRELVPICKEFAVTGTTKQAKQAIRCLYVNLAHGQDAVFSEILEVR